MRTHPTATSTEPLDPEDAAKQIGEAVDRRQIFELLLRAMRWKARFVTLLSVQSDEIRGQKALGEPGLDTKGATTLHVPRGSVPAFERVIENGVPTVGSLATGEPFIDGFLDALSPSGSQVLVLPVSIGTRVVALIAASGAFGTGTGEEVAELMPVVVEANMALARVLEARGTAAASTSAEPRVTKRATSDEGYEIEVSIADVAAKRTELEGFRRAEKWPEVAEGIRELIREGMEFGDPGEDEQLELLLELAKVEADRLGRTDRAIAACKSAQTIDASEPRVLDALERLYIRENRWLDCVEILEKRAALAETEAERIKILLDLATLSAEQIHDDDRAIEAYEKIVARDPMHEIAARELQKHYREREAWEPLIALLLDRASSHNDPQERVAALMSVANLYEDKIGDGRDAFLVWLTVFRREPERPHLLEQLERLAQNATSLHEVVTETKTLAGELSYKHPVVASGLWQLVGKWQRDRIGNRDEAAAAFDQAARLNPEVADEAASALKADQRWPELIALLTRRLEGEADGKRRAELCIEIGEIYEAQLGQPGEASPWYERALDQDPESSGALVALHRIYLDSKAWDALGEILPRLIESLGLSAPRTVIVDLYVELGHVLAEHLGRPEDAIEAYRDALALDAKHVPALQGLEQVYQATGQTEALLETTEAEVDIASTAEQVRRYADIAATWYELARLDRAAATWQKLLAIDPRNVTALKGLARALRDDEQWAELAVALRAQLKQVTEPFERTALLLEIADLFERQFDNSETAIPAYREVLAIDPNNHAALDALGRLYDKAGQWQPALEMLRRILSETKDRTDRSGLLTRIGQVHLSMRDAVMADTAFGEAIALDPDNANAHEGMARLLLQQGKLAAGAEKLLRASQLSANQQDMLRLLLDAAWVYRYRAGDNENARATLQRILEIDPEHADAKQALAELLHDTQEWSSLWTHLEEQAARARVDTAMDSVERHAILAKAARGALELGKFGTAIELYDLACSLDSGPATQLDRAEALYRSKALDAAAASYQTIATVHGQTLERSKLVEVHRRLGAILAELGKVPQAVSFYQKVLDIDPTNHSTLEDLAELNLSRNQFDEAIANLRARAAAAPPTERIPLLERIGNLYRDKLENPARAMSTYLEALEIDKGNRRILQRVLDLQTETGQWKGAVDTIERFIEIETDVGRRGAYQIASAEIRRTHLKDQAGALEHYETALDEMFRENPLQPSTRERALDAFHALREIVTSDAKYLEQAVRRMIKRVPKDDPVLVPLWDMLGDIYRTRLDHPQSAIEALEVAHSLDPDKSANRARLLAELYSHTGAKRPAQVTEKAAKLVEVDPTNADSYRVLGRTALQAGRMDEAWCVSRALVFLKQANSDEKSLYRRFQQHETRKAKGILDEDAWTYVRHQDEDLAISAIFTLVWEGAVALRAGPAKAFSLKPKERLAIEESTGVVAKIFKHASRVLNVALPDVYVQPRRPGRLLLANIVEKGRLVPAVIVGRDLMTGYRDTEIAASVGAMLALLRPSYYLKLTLATVEELEAALIAAAHVVGRTPRVARPELEQLTTQFASEMQRRLTRSAGEALLALLDRLPDKPDLVRWRNAVDATAQRAGLLISGDLAATARMVSSDSTGTQRPTQRVQELVAYSVSPNYFTTRRHLGVAID